MGSGGKGQSNASSPYGNGSSGFIPPSYAAAGSSPFQTGGQYYGNTQLMDQQFPEQSRYYGANNPNASFVLPGQQNAVSAMGQKYLDDHPEVGEQGLHPWYHWVSQGSEAGYEWGTAPEPINMGGGGGGGGPSGPTAEEVAAQQKRNFELQTIDEMWGARYDAVEGAVDNVDAQIESERQQAAVLGLDYNTNNDLRRRRIGKEFGNFWSSQNEDKLAGLAKAYGNPEQTESERALIESGDLGYEWDYDVYASGGGKKKTDSEAQAAQGASRSSGGANVQAGAALDDDDEDNPLGL